VGVRKSVEESLVVDGSCDEWLAKSRQALETQGFKKVTVESQGQLSADLKQKLGTVWWGSLTVTLTPEGPSRTRMSLKGTANVDNIFAVFQSPGQKVIDRFKAGLR